jgi:hypothetical protein
VTLHSYSYARAERAKSAGYPKRFAQQALGHNSKAVHRAYARHAHVIISSLGEYEKQAEAQRVIPFPFPNSGNSAALLLAATEAQGDGTYQGHA